jgi:Pyridoxamine 5'-phosphate oxidase
MWVAMSAAEREEFPAGVHVGVLSAAAGTAGQTLAVPAWYSYQPGGLLTVLTGRRSRTAAAIRAAGRFGLCAQDDSPPYRYVRVEGPVVAEEEFDPADRLAMVGAQSGSARRPAGTAGARGARAQLQNNPSGAALAPRKPTGQTRVTAAPPPFFLIFSVTHGDTFLDARQSAMPADALSRGD